MSENIISKQDVKAIMDKAMTEMKGNIEAQIKKDMERIISYQLEDALSAELKTFLRNEVKAAIEPLKAEIVANLPSCFKDVGKMVQEAIVAQCKKNLDQSYNMTKIFEGLFR